MGKIILPGQLREAKLEVQSRKRLPSFEDYRRIGLAEDPVMVPDRGFTKQLHALDPELRVVWDWGWAKWEIWRFPKDGKKPFHVMTVQTKDRTYRELGTDVLVKLQLGDPHRYGKKEFIAYFEEMDNQIQRRKEKDFRNLIESITKETLNFQRGVPQIQVPKEYKVRRAIAGE